MENREKVVRFCLITTIMQGITLLFIAGIMIMLVGLIFCLTGVVGDSMGLMENVNPDDVTAGWQVLFGAAGSFLGAFAGIVLVTVIVLLTIPLIAEIVALISGIRTYKKRDTADFKRMVRNDSIIKLVISAIISIVSLASMPSSGSINAFVAQLREMVLILLFSTPSIVTVVLSVKMLCNIKHIEELSDRYN